MFLLMPAFRKHGKHFIFDPDGQYTFETIEVGDFVSINRSAIFFAKRSRIIIGNKVMFGFNVTVVGGNHNTSLVGKYMYDVREKRPQDDQDVIFEDDIWVGSGAIILQGVRVGRGSIIAAGTLVNKDILPYSIVGGIPGRKIKTRFSDVDTILEHEKSLYQSENRLSRDYLQEIFNTL